MSRWARTHLFISNAILLLVLLLIDSEVGGPDGSLPLPLVVHRVRM